MTKIERIENAILSSTRPIKNVVTGSGEFFTAFENEEIWTVTRSVNDTEFVGRDKSLRSAIVETYK